MITLSAPDEFVFTPLVDVPVQVRVEGDLAEYITLETSTIHPGETLKGVLTHIPDVRPGDHSQRIILAAQPTGSGTIAATTEIAAQLIVRIPYPDTYLEGDFSFSADKGSDRIRATVMIENLGSESVMPDEISLSLSEKVIDFTPVPILSLSTEKFTDQFVWDLLPGAYTATLRVAYDDKLFSRSHDIVLGRPSITIDTVTYHGEEAGAIIPLDVSGRIAWNRPINVTIEAIVDGTYTVQDTFVATPTFSGRLYVEEIARETIVVTATALGESTSVTYEVQEVLEEPLRVWPFIIVSILILILWGIWRFFTSKTQHI